jgi:hypothetical protein
VNTSVRGKARRGSVGTRRVTPRAPIRTFRVRKPLELRRRLVGIGLPLSSCGEEQQEGKGRREMVPATGKGKPLRAEAQGRYSHETRREGLQAEQGAKRLRKPVGAAQPGEVSPVLVASCSLKRRRVQKPHGRPFGVDVCRLRQRERFGHLARVVL